MSYVIIPYKFLVLTTQNRKLCVRGIPIFHRINLKLPQNHFPIKKIRLINFHDRRMKNKEPFMETCRKEAKNRKFVWEVVRSEHFVSREIKGDSMNDANI